MSKYSIKKWFHNEIEGNYYTPDMPDIYAKDDHYVFAYGHLKNGEYREDILDDEIFVANAYTKFASYGIMEYKSAHGINYPLMYSETKHGMGSLIKGELYYVTTDKLIELDYLMSNMVQSKRVSLPVVTADRHLQCMAWTYFIHPAFETDMRSKDRITNYMKRHFIWNVPTADWSAHAPVTA